ncbi:MAG TPA: SDR family oxidoreductase [Candidatus Tectomicrobia bacterium]|jgi:3-oxoacyl-[acyl-carrier protein] reductase/meso-butanediol dehydrogenase/(S,S)-butanediol dehydrogenase/diacetyl reductase
MGALDGKVALITGAGGMKGIGRATALKLASQGADIVLSDLQRSPEDLPPQEIRQQWRGIDSVATEVEALGRRCLQVWCDLTRSEQIQTMVQQAAEHYGHLDILVNNARAIIGRDRVPVTELREDVWQHFLAVNTTAVFLCTKLVGQVMTHQGQGGRIINIASDAAKRGSAMGAAYSASKFAVLGLTQASALDLAPYKITVNAVCPGPVNTDRLSYWERAEAEARGMSLEAFRAGIVAERGKATPLGRIAESEDVANLVAFLASEEACFITGQAYNVNGGLLFH